jgi:hypothetical protein
MVRRSGADEPWSNKIDTKKRKVTTIHVSKVGADLDNFGLSDSFAI